MGKHQFIDVEGAERLVVLPESEYRRLIEAVEDAKDIGMARAANQRDADGTAVYVEGDLAFVMLDAPTMLAGAIGFRKVKLAELKARTGLSVSYISDMARGRKRGSIDAWRKLAVALDVPLEVLTAAEGGCLAGMLKG